ncbi:MAG: class III extradiol dioxygenase subunit B-like domain-containing protein [Candidatus Magasanikbacteria bacterium]
MSLVFAAIAPHPPILIPTIGQEALKKINKTKRALEQLEEDLYLSKPDILLVVAPHNNLMTDAFTLNVCTEYETDLRDFGDLSTRLKFKGDIGLATNILEASKDTNVPTVMFSERLIDHGATVPLFCLANHITNANIIPVGFATDLGWKKHVDFGTLIKDQIMNTNKRVAVIASGDLSHALTSDSPAGFNTAGVEFDTKIQEFLPNKNLVGMMQWEEKFIKNAAADAGFRTILILMGILHDVNYTYKSYCYENPLGVGYLTANFVL